MLLNHGFIRDFTSLHNATKPSNVKSTMGLYMNEFRWILELTVMLTFHGTGSAKPEGW